MRKPPAITEPSAGAQRIIAKAKLAQQIGPLTMPKRSVLEECPICRPPGTSSRQRCECEDVEGLMSGRWDYLVTTNLIAVRQMLVHEGLTFKPYEGSRGVGELRYDKNLVKSNAKTT